MAYPKAYIDAMLLNWGDRLFQESFQHARAQRSFHAPACLMKAKAHARSVGPDAPANTKR